MILPRLEVAGGHKYFLSILLVQPKDLAQFQEDKMGKVIPFTTDHEQVLHTCAEVLKGHSAKLDGHTAKLDAHTAKLAEHDLRFDALEAALNALREENRERFRRTDVLHEELRAQFNTFLEIANHTHKILDRLGAWYDKVDNHELRLDVIESYLKGKDS